MPTTDFIIALVDQTPVWALTVFFSCAVFLLLWSVKKVLYLYLRRLTNNSQFSFDSLMLNASQRPATLMVVAITLVLTEAMLLRISTVTPEMTDKFTMISRLALIAGIILFADKLARNSLQHYAASSPLLRTSGNLLTGMLRVIVFCVGILIILSTLGISITPIVASLGLGSLAIALALQPTLENFFSGIQMVADKPIRVGDYIELESGEQGFVEKIGWRSTWIKMLPNNIIIMPNSKLAQSKIINYYYPEKQLSVPVDVGVHYDSDLEHVEKVTLEVAREILKTHKWGIPEYDTFVVFHTFDNFSINFTVMLRAQEYFNRFFIKSEFIKALHRRFAQEGIIIPYPISAINFTQEKAVPQQSSNPFADVSLQENNQVR